MRIKNYKKILLLLIFISFLIGSFCLAQGRELEVKYPGLEVPGVEKPTKTKTALPEYLEYVFTFAIIIAGLLAFGALIYGGIRYLTSAGDPTKMSDAKNQVIAGFSGLIILLSSYLILNTINPQLVLPKKPPLQPAVAGIYAYVKADCIDEPEDSYDDRVLINENTPDFSERLPKNEDGDPQSLQCIEFRSGKEELTVKVYSNVNYSPEPPEEHEGDPGETKNVTGKSIRLDYHPPGVYLYASDNCAGDDYKIYQSGSATLPEFNDKTKSVKLMPNRGTIKVDDVEITETHLTSPACIASCEIPEDTNCGCIIKLGLIRPPWDPFDYDCACSAICDAQSGGKVKKRGEEYICEYDKERYAAILHEKENYIGKAMLYDQDPTGVYNGLPPGCRPLSYNMYGGPTSIGVSSITVYLKPTGEPIGDGVRFWGDKNYTKEKDEFVLPPEDGYYGDGDYDKNLDKKTGGSPIDVDDANDKITSMEMDGHYVALLFRDGNYENDCEVLMGSDPDFRNNRIGQCRYMGRTDCLSSFIIKARK